jgi:hypothetical protein
MWRTTNTSERNAKLVCRTALGETIGVQICDHCVYSSVCCTHGKNVHAYVISVTSKLVVDSLEGICMGIVFHSLEISFCMDCMK